MKRAIGVKALNKYINSLVLHDPILSSVYVMGEVTNCKHSTYTYFDLIEDTDTISCVSFSNDYLDLENGDKVIVGGYVSLFTRASKYQIIVKDIEEAGLGKKLIELKKLKEKLKNEGLFDEEHKKALPYLPKKIGIISSFKGAVVKDFLKVLKRRYPICQVYIYDTQVQGQYAEDQIIEAINIMDGHYDVIALLRGGGSKEDLSVFNSEKLVRRIFKAQTPFITAIGHQVDTSLVDYVSDVRARTPTEAAELVGPDIYKIKDMINISNRHNRANIENTIINLKTYIDKRNSYNFLDKYINTINKIRLENIDLAIDIRSYISNIRNKISEDNLKIVKKLNNNISLYTEENKPIIKSKDIEVNKEYILVFEEDKYRIKVIKKYD